jgi:hypothetical protein
MVAFVSLIEPGCRAFVPRGPSDSARAKVSQMIGPVEQREVPLRLAVAAVAEMAPQPVTIEVCAAFADSRVTVVTTRPEELGVILKGAAMQVGAPILLFVGEHGEVARPTLFCPNGGQYVSIHSQRGAQTP